MKIGFLGIDHLSLNYGVAAADKGFDVIFYDFDEGLVKALNKGDLDYSEPGLKDLLKKNKSRLFASSNPETLKSCELLYIAKDVPTDDEGNSDLEPINELYRVAKKFAHNQAILAVLCQVPPGYTRALDFPKNRLFYQLDTLVFGQAVERAAFPERYMIGCENSSQELPKALQEFVDKFGCPVFKVRYESAELTKIALNLFLISSVTTTNIVAEICEKIGADWFEIQQTLRTDRRIGPHAYLKPGLGIAGGNLERSLTSISQISYEVGAKNDTIESWKTDSAYRKDWVLNLLQKHVFPKFSHPKIGILGITYKENTSSIKNSPSIHLMKNLKGYDIVAFDPVVKEAPFEWVKLLQSSEEALDVEVLIIMTPWAEFKDIDYTKFTALKALIDPYNMVEGVSQKKLEYGYYGLGRSVTC
jgi:UDPglucose 6-dehydrogenase